jgi:putative transcriptional regulator
LDTKADAMINEQILVEKGLMIQTHYFTNYFLVAMPILTDAYFNRSVVYICEHTEKGAVGIVINQPLQSLRVNLSEILQDITNSKTEESAKNIVGADFPILCGGPVHPERGFVIHKPLGEWQSSLKMSSEISVTTSKDILLAIAKQQGPDKFIFSLGYANWIAGQMEEEIVNNFWLTLPASPNILFDIPFEQRWLKAMNFLGVDVTKLAYMGGHA